MGGDSFDVGGEAVIVGLVVRGCVAEAAELEPFEFEAGFVEALLHSALVGEEALHSGALPCEIFHNRSAEDERRLRLLAVVIEGRVGVVVPVEVGVEDVEGFGLYSAGAEETPGECDDALGEEGFEGADGLEAGEEGAPVAVEVGGVFGEDDGFFGEKAVFDGVLGDDGLAFGGDGAGGSLGVLAVGEDLPFGCHLLLLFSVLCLFLYVCCLYNTPKALFVK